MTIASVYRGLTVLGTVFIFVYTCHLIQCSPQSCGVSIMIIIIYQWRKRGSRRLYDLSNSK